MQIIHLLLADAMWIVLVLMSWEAWRNVPAESPASESAPAVTDSTSALA